MIVSYILLGFLAFVHFKNAASELPPINMDSLGNLSSFKDKLVSSCRACRDLASSFLKAVDETTRQSFAGGDADWEREKLGAYENSELRFIEIQEKLCSDVTSGKDQFVALTIHMDRTAFHVLVVLKNLVEVTVNV
ncbi:unnamed protein product [Larinioides sclopetarius]|uniref:Pectinesterase inhibitor domain-containing protein n=1 Tax=Larinioides sclopetarius TaxID=280406 RepID=A0AAV1YXJ6_9ARAC